VRERFLLEARTAARLSHPNIVPIHAVDERNGFVCYVMAYVDGESLAHRVCTRESLPAPEGARPLRETAWALGRSLIRGPVSESAITHRATELSLGMAAESLYQSLPRASRDQLGDLPDVLHRLQNDAQQLRRHLDGLQEVLNDAGEDASGAAYDAVRRDRDAIQAKLGDAVAALETIRLNLLRLHAGSLTVAGLTTHIGLAADVSAEVERLLAGQDEVQRLLQQPE